MLVQVLDIRVAAKEPEQFIDDGLEMKLLGGEQRESMGERKAGLGAEHGVSAGARAVHLELSVLQHVAQQVEILSHSNAGNQTTGLRWRVQSAPVLRNRRKLGAAVGRHFGQSPFFGQVVQEHRDQTLEIPLLAAEEPGKQRQRQQQ